MRGGTPFPKLDPGEFDKFHQFKLYHVRSVKVTRNSREDSKQIKGACPGVHLRQCIIIALTAAIWCLWNRVKAKETPRDVSQTAMLCFVASSGTVLPLVIVNTAS